MPPAASPLCQVAVTLTYAVPAGHALIGRALYLPADWAADEERRELAGVPDEVMFATKPELAGRLLRQAHDHGICGAFTADDEVYGGLDLRRGIRELGHVMAVRSNHAVTLPSGRRLTVKTAWNLVSRSMWQRMRTGSATKGTRDYHWAMIEITLDDTPEGHDDGHARDGSTATLMLIPVTIPERRRRGLAEPDPDLGLLAAARAPVPWRLARFYQVALQPRFRNHTAPPPRAR